MARKAKTPARPRDPDGRRSGEESFDPTGAPPRGPLPEGASPEDYLGGEKPHKDRRGGESTEGTGSGGNEVF
jgi:hypothetical protein